MQAAQNRTRSNFDWDQDHGGDGGAPATTVVGHGAAQIVEARHYLQQQSWWSDDAKMRSMYSRIYDGQADEELYHQTIEFWRAALIDLAKHTKWFTIDLTTIAELLERDGQSVMALGQVVHQMVSNNDLIALETLCKQQSIFHTPQLHSSCTAVQSHSSGSGGIVQYLTSIPLMLGRLVLATVASMVWPTTATSSISVAKPIGAEYQGTRLVVVENIRALAYQALDIAHTKRTIMHSSDRIWLWRDALAQVFGSITPDTEQQVILACWLLHDKKAILVREQHEPESEHSQVCVCVCVCVCVPMP
jgi:hypothetical protein